jgi:hypothetical protein
MTSWKSWTLVAVILTLTLSAAWSCAGAPTTRYRVEGLMAEAWTPGPYRPIEPGEIVDAHADRIVFQRYMSLVRSSSSPERAEMIGELVQELSAPSEFRRVVDTRRGVAALAGLNGWLGAEAIRKTRRAVVEAVVSREWALRDLALAERILNVQGRVDDEYESLRRAVLLDTESLSGKGGAASAARFWLCVRAANADSLSLELFGKEGPYSKAAASAVRDGAEAWMREHRVEAHVLRATRQSADEVLVMRVEGKMAIRVEMMPILSRRDGTLVLVSDPATDVDLVFR